MGIPSCDHTSVGVLVFWERKLLLIERKRYPFGLAPPAGHVDQHGDPEDSEEERYEKAAIAELKEETGLTVVSLCCITEGRMETPCRRPNGFWHYWRIYEAKVAGELGLSTEETRGHVWCTQEHMEKLLLHKSDRTSELEPVWHTWFERMDILNRF